jgi:hypothetical protein
MSDIPSMRTLQRMLVGVCAAALFFAVAVPHVHTDPPHAHPGQTCRACKLQDGFSAAPSAEPVNLLPVVQVAAASILLEDAPRVVLLTPQAPPRAPPALS